MSSDSDSELSIEPSVDCDLIEAIGKGGHHLADFIATSVTRIVTKHMWGAYPEIGDLLASIPRKHCMATYSKRRRTAMSPDEIARTLVMLFVEDAKEQRSNVSAHVLNHMA